MLFYNITYPQQPAVVSQGGIFPFLWILRHKIFLAVNPFLVQNYNLPQKVYQSKFIAVAIPTVRNRQTCANIPSTTEGRCVVSIFTKFYFD
jgi:hypothetical protein